MKINTINFSKPAVLILTIIFMNNGDLDIYLGILILISVIDFKINLR